MRLPGGQRRTRGGTSGRSCMPGHSQKRGQRAASGSRASRSSTLLSESPKECAPLKAVVRPRSEAGYRAAHARDAERASTGLQPAGVTLRHNRVQGTRLSPGCFGSLAQISTCVVRRLLLSI